MLELAIALTLYGDNFLRNVAKASKEVSSLKAITSSLKNENSFNVLAEEVKKTTEEGKRAEKEFKSLSQTIRKAFDPKNLNEFSERLEDITIRAGAVGGAITLGLKSVVTDATEFEKGLAEASTLVKIDFEKFKKLYSNQLLEISVELGQDQSAVTKAFYDAISAGFSPQKALEVIKTAGKAAIAGVSDISTANNALITVVKSWGIGLNQASDYIFKAVAKGRATFGEIARDIGGVAATVASAGVKFNEFAAVLAAATAKGLDTGQTMTSIREIVNSLIAPTSQAQKAFQKLGITVNKETLKQKGLIGTLKEITDAMKRAGLSEAEQAQMLSEIFGSVEAQKVVNMFVADPETFIKTLKDFQKVGGETDKAFKKMSQSTAFAFARLSEAIASTKIVLGALFLPVVKTGANALSSLALSIKNLTENHKTLAKVIGYGVGGFGLLAVAVAGFAATTSFALKSVSLFIEGLKFYATAGKTLFGVLKLGIPVVRAFTAALISNPILLVAAAIAAAGFLIYKNWDKIKPVISSVYKAVKGFFSGIGELIKKASQIGSSIAAAFKSFGGGIVSLLSKAVSFGKSVLISLAKAVVFYSPFGIMVREWQKILRFLSSINLFTVGSKIFSTLIKGLKSKAAELYNTVKGTLSKVRNLLPFSPAKEGPLSDLHKTGLRFIETIANGIKGEPLLKEIAEVLGRAKSLLLNTLQLGFSSSPLSLAATVIPGNPISVSTSSRKPVPATYNINLNVSVNGKADRQTAIEIAKAVEPVVRKVLREIHRQEAKVNYGVGDLYNLS